MKKEIIFIVEESLDGGFEARAVGESIFTEADTYSELKKNVIEAVKCHFEEEEKPAYIRLHLVKEEVVAA